MVLGHILRALIQDIERAGVVRGCRSMAGLRIVGTMFAANANLTNNDMTKVCLDIHKAERKYKCEDNQIRGTRGATAGMDRRSERLTSTSSFVAANTVRNRGRSGETCQN